MLTARGRERLDGWRDLGLIALAVGLVLVGWWSIAAGTAHAAVFSNTNSIALNDPNSQNNGNNNATAGTYPSTIAVTGLNGTVSNVTLTLNDVSYSFSDDIDVLLVGPGGQTLIPIAAVGPNTGSSEAASNATLTLSDAGTLPTATTPWGSSSTFKPANFGAGQFSNPTTVNGFNEVFESPAPAGPWGDPLDNGTGATFASQFDGTDPNGTWSLYVITTSGGDGTGSIAGGWSLNITAASVAATTTSVSSNDNPSFTSPPDNSVTLTAMVTSTDGTVGEGTVAFTDGDTTISGCGSVPVSSGQATCTTSFSTEGAHSLQASYAGTSNFAPSSGALSQQVDNHTTVTGNSYCNAGPITLNNPAIPPGDASPYASHVFVSGLGGTLSKLTVTLKGATYSFSQDIDALLVGPGGQSLILAADAGPNSNGSVDDVTLTLDDAAASTLSQTGSWGAADSSVTSKPFNYGGFNELWGPPTPAGPYGNPGPDGGGTATLGSTFDGTNPNGTWSLYLITTASDGTGSIAGGWCANVTTANVPATTTALTSNDNPSFTSAPGNSVTLTASVASSGATVGEGTVDFTDGGTTISGCGSVPVSSGQATCTTSFSSEGSHPLQALYGGTSNFAPSSGTLSQQVDDHTTVSGSSYCNAGTITLNNSATPPADASPYPSHVFVSGLPGNLTGLTVTLKGVTYAFSQDIDALLVGPGGQSLVLAADAGPNSNGGVSNVTLTLDDAAGTVLSQTGSWGAANSSVSSLPFNYGGFNEVWGSPAPAGPYGNPGPEGGGAATLGSTFDGTNANGTWSLYVITTASDGTGSIAGGWCINTTIQKAPLTLDTQVPSGSATIGDTISDSATLGGVPQGADAPTGTVTFDAYGPNDATCSNPPAFTATVPLSGAGTSASSGSFSPSVPGTYRWTASYGGDSDYTSQATGCSDPGESVVVSQASPSLSSAASASVSLGGEISDTATLAGGDNPTGTVTFAVYGPDDPTCANSAAFSETISAAGDGIYRSDQFTPTAAGTYRFIVTYGGDSNNSAAATSCGDAGESVVVSQAAPSLSTAASAPVSLGGEISDTATLAGGENPTGTVTFSVYGPDDSTCANAPAFTSAVTAAGDGSYGSASFTPTSAGTYRFVATYGGDSNNSAAATSCGDAGESVVVSQAAPSLTTSASAPVSLGNSISDSATLGGVPQGADAPTGTVTFDAYGPDDATCSNPPAFTSTVPLSGAGTSASSGGFSPSVPGTYRWTASYGGDSSYSSQATGCNDPGESVVVSQASPSLSSAASASVSLGNSISDTATLGGGANPTGTITFTLFGPDDPACAGTAIFTSTVDTVNGNGTYASDPFTASTAGTYNWVATYSGDANNDAAAAACESVVVTAAATQTTLASSANPAAAGQPVTFTAIVTGTDPTGTVMFDDGASTLGTGTVGPNGIATLTTSSLGAGSHSVTAVYNGDTNNRGSTSNAVAQVVSAPPNGQPEPPNGQPPSISIVRPSPGARYGYGQAVEASYTCSAAANGPTPPSCTGTVPNGSPIDTHAPGTHTFAVTAVGADGETVTRTVLYTVMPSNQAGVSHIGSRADGVVRFRLRLPGPGVVNVLETAWLDNYSRPGGRHARGARVLLQPAPRRFVFARARVSSHGAGAITVTVKPNSAGRKLLAHHRYQPVIRLWVSFTPTGGTQRDHGFYGLPLPDSPRMVDSCAPASAASDTARHQHIGCKATRRRAR